MKTCSCVLGVSSLADHIGHLESTGEIWASFCGKALMSSTCPEFEMWSLECPPLLRLLLPLYKNYGLQNCELVI